MQNSLKVNPCQSVPVIQLTFKGELVHKYPNINDAAFKNKLYPSAIWQCLSGKLISAGGWLWIKEENYKEGMKITYDSIKRKRKFLKS